MTHNTTHHYSSQEHVDSYSAYSDDFENDSRPTSGLSSHRLSPGNRRKPQHVSELESESTSTSLLSHRNPRKYGERKKRTYKTGASSYRSTWKPSSSTSSTKRKPSVKNDTVQARLLSAQRNRINTLGNELGEANVKLESLIKENRVLKTLQHRQEKSLRKFEDTEGDLPRLISQHMEDQRILKARLKKSQEAERISELKLKESNEEIQRMQNTLRRLKKVIFNKNLGERSDLAKQLAAAEEKQMEAERKNLQLEKKLHLTTQSYARQLRTEQLKHKETKEELMKLQNKFGSAVTKLKEKERALEVSNIYALRTKHSPEKSFLGSKLAITSRSDEKPTSAPHMHLPPHDSSKAIEEVPSPSKPAASILAATNDVNDFRQTIKSPLHSTPAKSTRENSELLDLSEATIDNVATQLNDMSLQNKTKEDAPLPVPPAQPKDVTSHHRPVFLTSNYSPSSTFISDRAPSPKHSPPSEVIKPKSPVVEKVDFAAKLKAEKQLEEEQKKLEEDRRKKATLLAKMKDLEEETGSSSKPEGKPVADDLSKLLGTNPKPVHKALNRQEKIDKNPRDAVMDQLFDIASREVEMRVKGSRSPMADIMNFYNEVESDEDEQDLDDDCSSRNVIPDRRSSIFLFTNEVENLHKGIPSLSDVRDSMESSEPELTFGGYAPTVAAPPKRKPSNQVAKKQFSPPGSESDEPLLDIDSGKMNKKSDLMQQLFGEQAAKSIPNGPLKKENSFSSIKSPGGGKAMPRAKPIHSGYPWERDVVAAPSSHTGNGDAYHPSSKKSTTTSPVVKPFPALGDDDIEEVTL